MRTLLLFAATAAALPAMDVDLRLGYGLRARSTDFTAEGAGTQKENWDSSNRMTVGAVIQPTPALTGAWLFGGRVALDLNSLDASDTDYTNVALHVQAGYGFLLTPLVRLELLPYVGLGYVDLEVAGDSGSATSIEFGAEAFVAVTLPSGFQLGGGVGYAWTTAEPTVNGTAVEIEQSGVIGTLFVGWRL